MAKAPHPPDRARELPSSSGAAARGEGIEGVDFEKLAEWMDAEGLPAGEIENPALLGGGTQNLLIRFQRGGGDYVLRRPPIHKRENSDETMRREARVLRALADSSVPHPRFIAGSEGLDVLGAAFYLMEPVRGFNPVTGLPESHRDSPEVGHAMGLSMAAAIADLGELDYLEIGLDGFGKPQGYLERQVGRWWGQLESYSKLPGYPGPEIPGLDAVARWLDDHRPGDFRAGVIHGDFHVGNVMFSYDGPELAALVDWELSTIGDPLVDLGWLLATSPDDEGGDALWDGFPRPSELVAHYARRSSREVEATAWYEVFACYKLGIILEGTHARSFAGRAPKTTGDFLHQKTLDLFQRACRRIGVG